MIRRILAAAFVMSAPISAPAAAQDPNASQAQDLSYCAGAVAAAGDLDVLAYPAGAAGEWAPLLGRILERLNREPGVEGMTGRYAASAARSYWAERPSGEREAAARACRERFGAD